MVEESCAQVDEETCQQMRAGMAQSMALSEVMISATAKLPPRPRGRRYFWINTGPSSKP